MAQEASGKLRALAKDLGKEAPRSPRALLGGYVIAARALDKCRALLAGTAGDYHFDCPLDRRFFEFAGIDSAAFSAFVAGGASDDEVGAWIGARARQKDRGEVVAWNNRMRDLRIGDLPIEAQVFLEEYIPRCVPAGRVVYRWFDVYDLEEGRM